MSGGVLDRAPRFHSLVWVEVGWALLQQTQKTLMVPLHLISHWKRKPLHYPLDAYLVSS